MGSRWGLLVGLPFPFALVAIKNEAAMIKTELADYGEYARDVRYRRIPLVW